MSPAAIDSRLAAIRDGDLMGKTVTMPGSLLSNVISIHTVAGEDAAKLQIS
jgi:hypothetical protein